MTVRPKFTIAQARIIDRILTSRYSRWSVTGFTKRQKEVYDRAMNTWNEEIRSVEYCTRNKICRRDLRRQGVLQ